MYNGTVGLVTSLINQLSIIPSLITYIATLHALTPWPHASYRLGARLVGWLEFNVPFQHKYGYIRDEIRRSSRPIFIVCLNRTSKYAGYSGRNYLFRYKIDLGDFSH